MLDHHKVCGDYSVNTGFDTVHKPIHQDVYTVLMVEKKVLYYGGFYDLLVIFFLFIIDLLWLFLIVCVHFYLVTG